MKSLSLSQKQQIISLAQQGHSSYQISSRTGFSASTCKRVIAQELPDLPRSHGGRPKSLSSSDRRYITRQIYTGSCKNAAQIARKLNATLPHPISTQTVRNALKEQDLEAVTKVKKPKLTKTHQRKRLAWAQKYQHWTVDDWKHVIWSDETKILFYSSNGREWVWKKKGDSRFSEECIDPTVKFGGGKINIWGCMGWNGVGIAVEVEGNLTKEQYVDILKEALPQSVEKLGVPWDQLIFQQDNDPKHTSGLATDWFIKQDIEVLDWPAQSPDLNPIEHLWFLLKQRLKCYNVPPKGTHELWDRVVVEWNRIEAGECQRLIESMPRRVAAVIKAKGGSTKY